MGFSFSLGSAAAGFSAATNLVGGLLSGLAPKPPEAPKPPKPPKPIDPLTTSQAQAEAANRQRRTGGTAGRQGTILTSPLGLLNTPTTTHATLLGA
jgi:hypothetical protein